MKLAKTLFLLVLILGVFGGGGYFAWVTLIKPSQPTAVERARPAAVPTIPPDPAAPELAKAEALKREKKVIEARDLLDSIVANYPSSPRIEDARNLLGELNADLALSTTPGPDKLDYVVKAGDSLDKIARQLKTSGELIMRSNNLANTIIQPGQHLSIFQPDFSLELQLGAKKVVLLNKGRFFKQYAVKASVLPGAGRSGEIKTRVAEKAAYRDGKRVTFGTKEYPGSSRWIVLAQPGFTIYPESPAGTSAAAAVAKPATGLGLDPADLEELHTLVSPGLVATIIP